MTPTAPWSMQNFFLSSSDTTATARPPSARVISSASDPSPPAAPHTSTTSPFSIVCGAQPINMRYAVEPQRRKQPASSHVRRAGFGTDVGRRNHFALPRIARLTEAVLPDDERVHLLRDVAERRALTEIVKVWHRNLLEGSRTLGVSLSVYAEAAHLGERARTPPR